MLSTKKKKQLEEILMKISQNIEVTLAERVLVQKYAESNQSVASWLHKARRLQQNAIPEDQLDMLLQDLDLVSPDPEQAFNPKEDDLGEWFIGAPSWLGRS